MHTTQKYTLNNNIYTLDKGIESVIKTLQTKYPDFKVQIDPHLRLFEELVERVESKNKTVTIRFYEGIIRVPGIDNNMDIKLMQTTKENMYEGPFVATVHIPRIFVSTAQDFPEKYALLDGYPSKESMLQDMAWIYLKGKREIGPDEIISMYYLKDFRRI